MKFSNKLKLLNSIVTNFSGVPLKEKYLVFESDDWGAIRMPDKITFKNFIDLGMDTNHNPFNIFDSLESPSDFNELFEILESFKDISGNHPIFTLNFIMSNPNFEKIKKSKFEQYYFDDLNLTYKQFSYFENSSLIKHGIELGLIFPEYHGRDHVNVYQWLDILKRGNLSYLKLFDLNLYGIDVVDNGSKRSNLMASLDFNSKEEKKYIELSIKEGVKQFIEFFNYSPTSFIAPCNVWHSSIEEVLYYSGITHLQSLKWQLSPNPFNRSFDKIRHIQGELNKFGQVTTVRNCYFEPSTNKNYNWVDECINKVNAAFLMKKPAIISTHRLNYMGGIYESNRRENLQLLKELISGVIKAHPDVKFISSRDLASKYLSQK